VIQGGVVSRTEAQGKAYLTSAWALLDYLTTTILSDPRFSVHTTASDAVRTVTT